MDMMKNGMDINLDTPEMVKKALLSGADLYNPETGEVWWLYNNDGSIACASVPIDDENLLAVVNEPGFDLYEDIIGGLNYTGEITDSPDYYTVNDLTPPRPDEPEYDERDAVFDKIASEKGWVVASPENVRAAVQSHMAEHGGETPEKENDMDKAAEIAAWKEKHVLIDRNGDDALVMHKMNDGSREFIVAHGYDEETGHWSHGSYYDSVASAAADLEGRAISTATDVILADFWCREDITNYLETYGRPVTEENIDLVMEELGLDGDPYDSFLMERLAETGNELIADAVGDIEPSGVGGDAPEVFVDKGISLKAEAESMRKASQALSADGPVDEREPAFTPDLS